MGLFFLEVFSSIQHIYQSWIWHLDLYMSEVQVLKIVHWDLWWLTSKKRLRWNSYIFHVHGIQWMVLVWSLLNMILGRPEIDQLLLHQHQYAEKVNHEYSPIFTRIFFYVKLPSESCNQSKVLTSSLDILEYPYFDCEWQWLLLELHKLHICNEIHVSCFFHSLADFNLRTIIIWRNFLVNIQKWITCQDSFNGGS